MSSRHLVDAELVSVLEAFPTFALSDDILPLARQRELPDMPVDEGLPVDLREISVPGPDGAPPVRILVYRPRGASGPLPAIVHIHGGGYVLGDPEMYDPINRRLAAELGCAIYSAAYRLAPETPYPGPVEDCYAALKWVVSHAEAEGLDPARIGIKGESAGGGLAAATALLARDRGEIALAFQFLGCPMLDDRTAVRDDLSPMIGEFVWTRPNNAFGWRALLGREPGGDGVPAYASPARATDLAGLPQTFINVGALDLFLDEDLDYARRLAHAGVPVELHVYPGCFHGYSLAVDADVVKRAARDETNALRRMMSAKA